MKQYVRFVDLKYNKHKNFGPMIVDNIRFPSMRISLETYGMAWREVHSTWNYPLHEHQSFEINYVTQGTQVFTVNGTEYIQHAGDMIFVRPGDVHCSRAGVDDQGKARGFKYFVMHFFMEDPEVVPYLQRSNQPYHPADSKVTLGVTALIQHFIQWLKSEPSWGLPEQLQLRSDFYGLLAALVAGLVDVDSDGSAYLAHRIAGRIEQGMRERFDRQEDGSFGESGIQRIADEMGISASHCYKVFKRIYQMSPRQYISFRILDEAKSLLNNPDLSIEEISFRLKYHDAAHFSRQFKRWTGYYPTQYRKQIRKVDF